MFSLIRAGPSAQDRLCGGPTAIGSQVKQVVPRPRPSPLVLMSLKHLVGPREASGCLLEGPSAQNVTVGPRHHWGWLEMQSARLAPALLSLPLYFCRIPRRGDIDTGVGGGLPLSLWSPWAPAPVAPSSPGRSAEQAQGSGTGAPEVCAQCQQILGHRSLMTLSEGHRSQEPALHPSGTVLQQMLSALRSRGGGLGGGTFSTLPHSSPCFPVHR